ncbi:MAG TPA: vWA domain-containing protein [Fontimonas sp.]
MAKQLLLSVAAASGLLLQACNQGSDQQGGEPPAAAPTQTPLPATPTPSAVGSPQPTPSATATPSSTPPVTTPTSTPTSTPVPTSPSASPVPTAAPSAAPPTATVAPTSTPTSTSAPSSTPTPTPTAGVTPTPVPVAGLCDGGAANDLLLLVDVSSSMSTSAGAGFAGSRLDLIKRGLAGIIDQRSSADRSGLVTYESSARLRKALDNNHAATRQALEAQIANGATNAEPGIRLAQAELASKTAGGIIIHLTDGDSNGDSETAAQEAKDAGTQFYAIAVGDGLSQQGLDSLKAQASEPKGVYYFNAVTPQEFDVALASVGSSLRGGLNLIGAGSSVAFKASDGSTQVYNEVSYRQDATTPANDSPGGDSGPLPLPPLASAGNGVDVGVARARASGAHQIDAQTASTLGEVSVSSVSVLFNGAEMLRIDGAGSRSQSRGERVTGDVPGSTRLNLESTASAEFTGVTVAGTAVPLVPPNTEIDLPGMLRLVLNEQKQFVSANTSLLAVTVARLELLNPADGSVQSEIRIGNSLSGVSCGGSLAFDQALVPTSDSVIPPAAAP